MKLLATCQEKSVRCSLPLKRQILPAQLLEVDSTRGVFLRVQPRNGRGSPNDRKKVDIFRRFKFCRAVLHYENYEINTPTKFTRYTVGAQFNPKCSKLVAAINLSQVHYNFVVVQVQKGQHCHSVRIIGKKA